MAWKRRIGYSSEAVIIEPGLMTPEERQYLHDLATKVNLGNMSYAGIFVWLLRQEIERNPNVYGDLDAKRKLKPGEEWD